MVLLVCFIFIASTLTFGLLFSIYFKRKFAPKVRIEKFLPQENITENSKGKENLKENRLKKSLNIGALKTYYSRTTAKNKLGKMLELSGIKKTPEEFILIRILVAFVFLALFFLLGVRGIILYLVLLFGLIVPTFYVKRRIKKRLALFSEQLAEALGIIANGMRAGFSFMQAMKMVASEMADPLGAEFTRTLNELNLGVPFEEGFASLANRIPSKELELVVNALLIQRTTGGNLSELLDTMQETIRGRVRLNEELNTLTAQGKMSSWIITLLPPSIAIYLNFVNPEYFQPMFIEPLGWLMLSASIFFIVIGWLIIRKIVRIEV